MGTWSSEEPVLPHGASWGKYTQGSNAGGSWYKCYLKARTARLRGKGAVAEVQLWAASGDSTDGTSTYSYQLAHGSGSSYTATSQKSVRCTSKVNYALKWTMYYTLDSAETGATLKFYTKNVSQSTGWTAQVSVKVPEEVRSSDISVFADGWTESDGTALFRDGAWTEADAAALFRGDWQET